MKKTHEEALEPLKKGGAAVKGASKSTAKSVLTGPLQKLHQVAEKRNRKGSFP